jgi:hypothetical protein
MLTAFVALALATPALPQDQGFDGPALISKMLAYYSSAKTMTGTITQTVKVGNASEVALVTTLQFEKPSKLYLRQQKKAGNRRVWLTVSNGKEFSYNPPSLGLSIDDPNRRLLEPVVENNVTKYVKDIYVAAASGLGDRSAPLDIAIGRNEDLRFLRDQWQTVEYKGTTDYEDLQVHVILGQWRQYGNVPASGQYRMFITDGGELKQFARSETLQNDAGQTMPVFTTWDVKLVKNGKVDPALFAKVK